MLYPVSFIVIVSISPPVIKTENNNWNVTGIALGTISAIIIVIFIGKNYYY